MSKILRNKSLVDVDINDIGISVLASSDYTLEPENYGLAANSIDLKTLLDNDTIDIVDTDDSVQAIFDTKATYYHIPKGAEVTILKNKQNRVDGGLEVEGYLEIEGQLIIEE